MRQGLINPARKLRYPDPSLYDPHYGINGIQTLDLTSTPGNVFQGSIEEGKDLVIVLSPTNYRSGIIEISAKPVRSLKIVGGLWRRTAAGTSLNYHIHAIVEKWAYLTGQEVDASDPGVHADIISISGGSTFEPDVFYGDVRVVGLNATNETNHADIFQPQGKVGYIYGDRVTYSSNYDGYTIAADSTGNAPAKGVELSRHNSWYQSVNEVNPITAHYWLNSGGAGGNDTAPFPLKFNQVYVDLTRGVGRGYPSFDYVVFPHSGQKAKGQEGSAFTPGEEIGAAQGEDGEGIYAYVPDPKMLVTGKIRSGSPAINYIDVFPDTDGHGSYVKPGIGTNYHDPGATLVPGVNFPVGSWL